MNRLVLVFISIVLLASGLSAHAERLSVRVRVKRELKAVDLSGLGLRIAPPGSAVPVAAIPDGMTKVKITHPKDQWLVRWVDSQTTQQFQSDRLSVRGQILRIGVEPVPYDLEVIPNPSGGLDVVANLDLDTYIAGVLPAEMPVAWPLEALKAQAVAARSFVLRTARERRDRHFDVDSTIIDQVYKFLHQAETDADLKNKLNRAIRETQGQILLDTRGRVLKAFYSADCGCQTEDPKFVWGHAESFASVKDHTCSKRKPIMWDMAVDRKDVRAKLVAALGLPEDSHIRTIQVAAKTPSGRVSDLVATMTVEGKTRPFMMTAQEFRRIFGYKKIRSTDFSVQWLGEQMHVRGAGAGHGVGLCQTGAKELAAEGTSYKDILKFYYPKAKLGRLRTVAG